MSKTATATTTVSTAAPAKKENYTWVYILSAFIILASVLLWVFKWWIIQKIFGKVPDWIQIRN